MPPQRSWIEHFGFTTGFVLIFTMLKLMGKISMSWWWVVSPVWITALLTLMGYLIVVLNRAIKSQHKSRRSDQSQ